VKVEPRAYKCLDCGNVQMETTNHTGDISAYCRECSWKSIGFGRTGHHIPALGSQTFRRFAYVGNQN
jgi:DNA-directed RNA polymerase subunit RPC12/RpoP